MKTIIKLSILSIPLLMLSSCNKEDSEPSIGLPPSNVEIHAVIVGNSVEFTATAENAFNYYWNFDNGHTASGETVTMEFQVVDDYNISLMAIGKGGQTSISKIISITEGSPAIYNPINRILCGYNSVSNECNAVWVWDHKEGAYALGEPAAAPSNYFDPIDLSIWESADNEMSGKGCYNDEYSFKINRDFEYINNCNGEFLYNWAWANKLRGQNQSDDDDIALSYTAPASSWETEKLEHGADTAWVLRINNNGWIGVANGAHEYQILKINSDTLWLRFNASNPDNFTPIGNTKSEWGYLRLLKQIVK